MSTLTLLLCILGIPVGFAVGVLLADFLWWLTH
jgi:hypothetical protein